MTEAKSSLLVAQGRKNETALALPASDIEYREVGAKELVGELSDEEKEAEFNRQHEEYIRMKLNRKKQLLQLKREEFGTSSSDEDPTSSDEEEINDPKPRLVEVKRSRGKLEMKNSQQQQQAVHAVVVELKKLTIDTELTFLEKEFEVNKKTIPYARIMRLALTTDKSGLRLRVGLASDEDLVLDVNSEAESKKWEKLLGLFLRFGRMKLEGGVKLGSLQCRPQSTEIPLEQREGASAIDKLFKKSQVIGSWEERVIAIKQDGLYSYRSGKPKPTMFIAVKEVREVHTNFEFYKDSLILRLVYSNTRTDFAVPVDSKLGWMTVFAGLLPH